MYPDPKTGGYRWPPEPPPPLDADLQAIAALSGTGIAARTGTNTWALRSIAGTTNQITVANGSGAAGNPTISISTSYAGQASITTLGTVGTGTWNASPVGIAYGGTGASTAAQARINLGLEVPATYETATREKIIARPWQPGASAADNAWVGLDYSPEQNLYVAVSADGTDRVMTSKDGRNWSSVNVPSTVWRTVRWVKELGRWIATGHGTSGAMWSEDGSTWNAVTTPDGEWVNFAYSPKLNLLVANNRGNPSTVPNAGQSMVSTDGGDTWTLNALPVNNDWLGTGWSNDLEMFVIVGSPLIDGNNETPYVLTSTDGYNWTPRLLPQLNHWWNVIWVHDLQKFVAIANNYDLVNAIMTSPDGITWTSRATPSAANWYDLAWSQSLGMLVGVANNGTGRVMYSTDGESWTLWSPSSGVASGDQAWRKVVWSEGQKQFVAVATSGAGNRVMFTTPVGSLSGTYTPTLTGISNVSSTTSFECLWSCVDGVVTVSGTLQVVPTAATTSTNLRISLPFSSDIATAVDAAGSAGANAPSPGVSGRIFGASTLGDARLQFVSLSTATHTFGFSFQYIIK